MTSYLSSITQKNDQKGCFRNGYNVSHNRKWPRMQINSYNLASQKADESPKTGAGTGNKQDTERTTSLT